MLAWLKFLKLEALAVVFGQFDRYLTATYMLALLSSLPDGLPCVVSSGYSSTLPKDGSEAVISI